VKIGALAVAAAIVAAPAGWMVSDALERNNDFCNACHLPSGEALHVAVREDFDGRPPTTLAAGHGAAHPPGPEGDAAAFRCIDCHGGVSLVGRLRVKTLAAKDAFWWVVGDFEEPRGMRWPLWDEDCAQCHESFDVKADADGDPAFHDLGVHNVELGVGCVECHRSHERGANVDAWYLKAAVVRQQCARCHAEFEQLTSSEHLEEGTG
jgi:hypothetical protein